MQVELSPEQRELLLHLLDVEIRELGPEIRHTRTREYKDGLKAQRQELRTLRDLLLGRVSGAAGYASPAELPGEGVIGSP